MLELFCFQAKNVWSTPPQNESKFNQVKHWIVYLDCILFCCRLTQSREMCYWSTRWRCWEIEFQPFCYYAIAIIIIFRNLESSVVLRDSQQRAGGTDLRLGLSLKLIFWLECCIRSVRPTPFSGFVASPSRLVCQGPWRCLPPWLDLQGGSQLPESSAPVQPLEWGQTCQDWTRWTGS